MAGKQITELDIADNLEDGDLMIVRKSGLGKDQSLSRANLIESIGNSAVNGYTAVSDAENKIVLTASNAAIVPAYKDGMKISFISPIATTAIVQVKIGVLGYIKLFKYSSKETVQLIQDEYVEAIYTDGVFKQTNNLNTHLVWSNEYVAKADIALDESTTVYNLTSAIGVKKPNYYAGMSLLFTVPMASKGIAFVDVDGLGTKKLGESGGSIIAKDIYKDQAIMAIYDGKEFIKQKFAAIHHTPIIPEPVTEDKKSEELTKLVEEKVDLIPQDIWAEDYAGDPDDPANTTSPKALDSKGKPMFASTITVGDKGAMYKTLPEAIIALVNDYGDDGGGNLFAIEMDSNYSFSGTVTLLGKSSGSDYSWITLFAKNNATLNFANIQFNLSCIKKSPIFNFKMSGVSSTVYLFGITGRSAIHKGTPPVLIFGKNTSINYIVKPIHTYTLACLYMVAQAYGLRVEAKYGITVKTNAVFCAMSCVLNKGNFIFTGDSSGFLFQLHGSIKSEIFNTKISSNLTNPKAGIFMINSSDAYFRNVTSTDRTGKSYAIKAMHSNTTLENCNFSCKTDGTLRAGFDIVLDPLYSDYHNNDTEIHLKNTKGNTSHIVNKKIKNMIIYEK